MKEIDWSKQHSGVHRATFENLKKHMPDVYEMVAESFPKDEDPNNYTWDVKVHMLMPGQYPCIPNWHYDNVPRINNVQDFNAVCLDKHMYLWVSGHPLTQFKAPDGEVDYVKAKTWVKFTQCDKHRGTVSHQFTWRGFIRATHKDIQKPQDSCLRLHSQVYLDAETFRW